MVCSKNSSRMRWTAMVLFLCASLGIYCVQGTPSNCTDLPSVNQHYTRCVEHASFLPTISNVNQTPTSVEYYYQVNVTTVVLNITVLGSVQLFYRVNIGNWRIVEMNNLTANTFSGIIPRQPWNSHVDYYVNATDELGQSTIDDNQTSYYRYVVMDTIPPSLSIISPRQGDHIFGQVEIDFIVSDAGSGIQRSEVYIDDALVGIGSSDWSAWVQVTDGGHIFLFKVIDNAGNEVEHEVSVEVTNPPTPFPIPGFPFEAVIVGVFIAIGLLLVLRRRGIQLCYKHTCSA
ncbi:MAG: Ig-like domain-containing protein [Promethearchaeota archaeon]